MQEETEQEPSKDKGGPGGGGEARKGAFRLYGGNQEEGSQRGEGQGPKKSGKTEAGSARSGGGELVLFCHYTREKIY